MVRNRAVPRAITFITFFNSKRKFQFFFLISHFSNFSFSAPSSPLHYSFKANSALNLFLRVIIAKENKHCSKSMHDLTVSRVVNEWYAEHDIRVGDQCYHKCFQKYTNFWIFSLSTPKRAKILIIHTFFNLKIQIQKFSFFWWILTNTSAFITKIRGQSGNFLKAGSTSVLEKNSKWFFTSPDSLQHEAPFQ